jgi:Domain of unknown function (DUF5666)
MNEESGSESVLSTHRRPGAEIAALALVFGVAMAVLAASPAGASGRPTGGQINFEATVVSLPATAGFIGDWTVGTMTVHVGTGTAINRGGATVAVGATVHVVGTLAADGSVNAISIQVMPPPGAPGAVALCGVVTGLPAAGLVGDWQVGGTTVHVAATTEIDQHEGDVAVGVTVNVRGQVQGDGSMNALEIAVEAGGCGESSGLVSSFIAVLHLTAAAAAPAGAEGVVVTRHFIFADGFDRQDLKVGVEGLLPGTAYEVMVDSVSAGVITTNDDGEGHLFLSNAGIPDAGTLPAGLQPVDGLKQVSINDPSATPVLTGDFADANVNTKENPAPDYIAAAVLTSGVPGVVGIVAATIKGPLQELTVGVWGLTAGADYSIVIDGTTLATLTASATGRIGAEFSSAPEGDETALPAAFMPVSALLHVDLLDQASAVVASGDFRTVKGNVAAAVAKAVQRHLGH